MLALVGLPLKFIAFRINCTNIR